jgi:hypothetical protein
VLRTSAAESPVFAAVNILATLGLISSAAGGQQDDALPSLRRGLDYIAANSITPSRGAADYGEYREVAGYYVDDSKSVFEAMRTFRRFHRMNFLQPNKSSRSLERLQSPQMKTDHKANADLTLVPARRPVANGE